jgi:hypothetical protein
MRLAGIVDGDVFDPGWRPLIIWAKRNNTSPVRTKAG